MMAGRGGSRWPGAVLAAFLLGSGGIAGASDVPSSAPRPAPPSGSLDPVTSGAVDATAWVRLPGDSLEAAEAAMEGSPGSEPAAPDSAVVPAAPQPQRTARAPAETTENARFNLAREAVVRAAAPPAAGVYAGYPGWAGAMIVAPADGPAAFRSGVAGLPGIGILWTPGWEIRLGQAPGLYASNGFLLFGNLFLGRTWLERERDYTGLESGLGYRWILADRRGLRWIAAVEGGGYWRPESAWPDRPCLRAYWLLVE